MNITDIFTNTLYEMACTPLPKEVSLEARKCVLDLLGSMIGGTNWLGEKLNAYLDLMPPADQGATVVNMGRRGSLQTAVLVNGMNAHVFDIDDGHRFSTVHLGATVIPAVLAACEYYGLEMEDLLRGVTIGYETSIRMGRCLQPAHRARGFHSSGTAGTLGAAMGVAAALRFTREETKAALAAAASSAAGINEMMKNVSSMKPYNIGRAGHDGITAALIAKAGFQGPHDPLGGSFGFLKAMAETVNPSVLSLETDCNWNILGAYHKPYASCRHTHAAIDGALDIMRQHHPDLNEIEKIVVRMYGQGVKAHDHTDIPSIVAGKMSTPFCVGLALETGRAGIASFCEETIHNTEILRLASCTQVLPDENFTAQVPYKRAANVEIQMKDGTSWTSQVDYAKGEPEVPMTIDEFKEKFFELAAYGGKSQEECAAIAKLVLTGEQGSLAQLMAHLQ